MREFGPAFCRCFFDRLSWPALGTSSWADEFYFAVADHMATNDADTKNRRRTMAHHDLAPRTPSRSLYPSARDPLTSFHRQIDRLFDDFFAPMAEATTAGGLWPSVDVY
ncbi:hypothetical protein NKI01_23425 [Mesorhizobium sp. M0815]